MTRPISFLSDFGHADEFVGVVHGVIRRISGDIEVIDVTHGVPRGNVRAGALALTRAIQFLPNGVVLAVVDPGVGGERRAIAAETAWGYFVGPDNGLLAPAVAIVGGATRIVSLEAEEFRLPRSGPTFDGRDVFAPAAAVLASGEAGLGDLGPEVPPGSLTPLLLPLVEHIDGTVAGEVWWVDRFGNAETNVSPGDLEAIGVHPGGRVTLRVGLASHELEWRVDYGSGDDPLVHVDSSGMIAVAVPGGRADETLNMPEGTAVVFGPATPSGRGTRVEIEPRTKNQELRTKTEG
ncbi:MAG: SAM-dependent chlorinase/fluorinase [Acidimicrobiia bacterium]